jgi:hypothetical protein
MDVNAGHGEKANPAGHTWFNIVLVSGAILAAVLLTNSIINYVWMTPRIVTGQIRREMNRVVVSLDQQVRKMAVADRGNLTAVLQNVRNTESEIAWIEIRSKAQGVLAHVGIKAGPSFTEAEVRDRMRIREPLATTRKLASGDVVAEVFPFRVPSAEGRDASFAHLEIAMRADKADSALWPLRRNLIINCTAACALLLALITMRLRFRSYLRGRKLEHELEIAREVQRALLPSSELAPACVAAASDCVPASGIGGDIHDLFETDDGNVALVCGDVSGKGIPAALLMGVLHGAIRSMDWYRSAESHEAATRRLNRLLYERASDARFATLFWGYYDTSSERLHYINAGHCPPLLVRRWRESVEIRPLEDGGQVLGLLPRTRYQQSRTELCPGDLLILYSDGVVEAANSAGEEFGQERLRAVITEHATCSPEQIRAAVLRAVVGFAGSAEFADDLTLMAIRFHPEAVSRFSEAVLEGREVLTS